MNQTHKIAEDLFGESYTVERREFADGDKRTLIIHSVGWSDVNYVQAQVWVEKGDVWIEYVEGDVRQHRTIIDFDEFDPDADLMEYIW